MLKSCQLSPLSPHALKGRLAFLSPPLDFFQHSQRCSVYVSPRAVLDLGYSVLSVLIPDITFWLGQRHCHCKGRREGRKRRQVCVETVCWNTHSQTPKHPQRITRTLATDPNTGEILSPHLPTPVNMEIPSLKEWGKPPMRAPGRMGGGEEGLVWGKNPATSTLFNL